MEIVPLAWPADGPRLQRLLEQCSDYYELHEGCVTPADASEFELTQVLPNGTPDQLYVLGMQDEDGVLHAFTQVFRDCPEAGRWWIGGLVVAPERRSSGLGAAIMQHVTAAAEAAGVHKISLIVSPDNPRGQRFWESAGFRDDGKEVPVTARNGYVSRGRFMSKALV